jgi:hypothetical protein
MRRHHKTYLQSWVELLVDLIPYSLYINIADNLKNPWMIMKATLHFHMHSERKKNTHKFM